MIILPPTLNPSTHPPVPLSNVFQYGFSIAENRLVFLAPTSAKSVGFLYRRSVTSVLIIKGGLRPAVIDQAMGKKRAEYDHPMPTIMGTMTFGSWRSHGPTAIEARSLFPLEDNKIEKPSRQGNGARSPKGDKLIAASRVTPTAATSAMGRSRLKVIDPNNDTMISGNRCKLGAFAAPMHRLAIRAIHFCSCKPSQKRIPLISRLFLKLIWMSPFSTI
jgi:hypothetical protein